MKIEINGKEYKCSNTIYYYIQSLINENKMIKFENNAYAQRVISLDEDIERLKEEYVMLQNSSDEVEEELQEKIDKALKYIEENRYTNNEIDMVDIMNYTDFDVVLVEDLIKILKGKNNE